MKRVLYITYDGITDALGQSQILPYLKGLSAAGYDIHILSFEKRKTFSTQREAVSNIINENNLTWHYHFFATRPKYVSKFYDLLQLKRLTKKLHRQYCFDAVHCRSYIASQAGLLLKMKFGVKFFFDMRGLWIDERIDNGQWNRSNILFRQLIKRYRKIEKKLFEKADTTISLTQKAKDYLVNTAGINGSKIVVIPCCVDEELFNLENISKRRVAELKQELSLNHQDYLVVYSGSLGGLYLVEETMLFFKTIKQKIPTAKLLILSKITIGQLKPYLHEYGINENDILLRWSYRADMPCYLSLCNIALCFIRPDFSKIASCPTKLPEYLAMGIPVVINAGIGDDDEIINKAGCGVILQSFSEPELETGVIKISQFKVPFKQAIQCVKDYYLLEDGVKKYLSIYKKI